MKSSVNNIATTVPGLYRLRGRVYLMHQEHVGIVVSKNGRGEYARDLPKFGVGWEFLPPDEKVEISNPAGNYQFPFLCRSSRYRGRVFLMTSHTGGVIVNSPENDIGLMCGFNDFPQHFERDCHWQPLGEFEILTLMNE